ncbi:hypothetical protein SprV_0401670400 [Sparganum proliferum]
MLTLDATTVILQDSFSTQFLGLLIAKLQLCVASKIHFPPVRGQIISLWRSEKTINASVADLSGGRSHESEQHLSPDYCMQLVPAEEVRTVGFPVQGLTKDVLCSNVERICWKVVAQIQTGDGARFVLKIKALLTLAEICIVHHRSRSGIMVALKALRLLSRKHEDTTSNGRTNGSGICQIFANQPNGITWLRCRAVLAKCQLADLSSIYNLKYRPDYVSLCVPEEPDLPDNIRHGREEADAMGLTNLTRIFKLYEELYQSRMQPESLGYQLKESQSDYTLEEIFIQTNILDVLTETKRWDNQNMLEEVVAIKKRAFIYAARRCLREASETAVDTETTGLGYVMACLRLREIMFRTKVAAMEVGSRSSQNQMLMSIREDLSKLMSGVWDPQLFPPFLQFDILAQTSFVDLQLLLLDREPVNLAFLLNNMRKALYLAIVILGDTRAQSFVWSIIAALTAILLKNRKETAASAVAFFKNGRPSAPSKTSTPDRPAPQGTSNTDALLRLLWTSVQCCCRIRDRPTLHTSSTTPNDTALPNLPMHLVYELIAPKVLGALKQRHKSFYEYKFSEKKMAIPEDPQKHCQLLLSIMSVGLPGLSSSPATTVGSVSSKTDEEKLKRHFSDKEQIALLAPTLNSLAAYRERLTSLYSAKSLYQEPSHAGDGLGTGFEGDQFLLEPPSTPLYRPDAVYWGQSALALHQLMIASADNTPCNVSDLALDYSALKQLEDLLTNHTTEYEVDYTIWLRHLEPITPALYETGRITSLTQSAPTDANLSNKHSQNELLFLSIDVTDVRNNPACLLFTTRKVFSTSSKQLGNVFVEVFILPHRAELRNLAIDLKKLLLHLGESKTTPEEGRASVSQGRVTVADSGPVQQKPATIAKKKSPQDTATNATEKQFVSWLTRFDALWVQRKEFTNKRPILTKKAKAESPAPIGIPVQPTVHNLRYFANILHPEGFCGKLEKSEVQDYLSRTQ